MRIIINIFFILIFLSASVAYGKDDYRNWVHSMNIPLWIKKIIDSEEFGYKYSVSFHINPFYLRGDFNGDDRPDIAILIKEKKTDKSGIAVIHYGGNEIFILGAGRRWPGECRLSSCDNFEWMDVWTVNRRGKVGQSAHEGKPPVLKGEAILAEKSESANGLIYWNGSEYLWYQQGD